MRTLEFCIKKLGGVFLVLAIVTAHILFAEDNKVPQENVGSSIACYYWDWGDAPTSYKTLSANNGATHGIEDNSWRLGANVDYENDGQPNTTATGDDINGTDDEDGVVFNSAFVRGQTASITVSLSKAGWLNAWMDFNRDGDWDEIGEKIVSNVSYSSGGNKTVTFTVPSGASLGYTYLRFRFCGYSGLNYYGSATNGEVEDYKVEITGTAYGYDYGDAPTTYATLLANDGARHQIIPDNPRLGAAVDAETDGQPNADATGDDITGTPDDEDGVVFNGALVQGQDASITITASAAGYLNVWFDLNSDGDFADYGEKVITNDYFSSAGSKTLTGTVPDDALVGPTFIRFRFSTDCDLNYYGAASNGEVEDYQVEIIAKTYDMGDAPSPYPTLLANDGARHLLTGSMPRLGALVDTEANGQPNADATGDDVAASDDEDGVTFTTLLVRGATATVLVTASTNGKLSAWIDFSRDGDWIDASEKIFSDRNLVAGSNILTFSVPTDWSAGVTFARFRFSTLSTCLTPTGLANDGEVEDYRVEIVNKTFDYGDLPSPYPTLKNNGARHIFTGTLLRLGAAIDVEGNGIQTTEANGDDNNGTDDEDGVNAADLILTEGSPAVIGVYATNTTGAAATLYGFLDLNKDGDFDDAGEKANVTVPTGSNNAQFTLTFGAPAQGKAGTTYARFRLSADTAAANANGTATGGEVEDYKVTILDDAALDWGDCPDESVGTAAGNYQTMANDLGPRHVMTAATLRMGALVDAETNGQQSAGANGDDNTGSDDEDGVIGPLVFVLGTQPALSIRVLNSTGNPAVLSGWIDMNKNGVFEANERSSLSISTGVDGIVILNMPTLTGGEGFTFARFRLSTQDDNGDGHLEPTGALLNGEVEDYQVQLTIGSGDEDHGDAPTSYGDPAHTSLDEDLQLGPSSGVVVDGESISYFSQDAVGDDAANSDDENGVATFPRLKTSSTSYSVTVLVFNQTAAAATLVGWIDFNKDGIFSSTEASMATVAGGTIGSVVLSWTGFSGLTEGTTYARFRIAPATSGLTASTSDGTVAGGEVEDYPLPIENPIVVDLTSFSAMSGCDGVQVEWEVQSAINHAGYNLYRSATENGNFVRLNDKLITTEYAISAGRYQYADNTAGGASNYYKLEEVSLDGALKSYGPIAVTATGVEQTAPTPESFALYQNYPNPFNPTTTIAYDMPEDGMARLVIYNMSGRQIRTLLDGPVQAGSHIVRWDALDDFGQQMPSGLYVVSFISSKFQDSRKMLLIR